MSLRMQLRRIVIMIFIEYAVPSLALNYYLKRSNLFVYMHEKQIPMQKWICMKCPHTSHVEVDQFLNSQHAWACWDMVFEIPRLTVKCILSLTKWIDNLSRYWWFQIPLKASCTGHRLRKAKQLSKRLLCFLFRENLLGIVSRLLFFCSVTSSVPNTQINAQTPITTILAPIYYMNLSWM